MAAGKYTTGVVKVGAISSNYIGSNIAQNSAADVVVAGPTVSVPSGYYAAAISTSVAIGSVQVASIKFSPPIGDIVVNPSNGEVTVTRSISYQNATVKVNSSGYVDSNVTTPSAITVSSNSASITLSTAAAATITPTESSQTAVASGKYTLGPVTVAAIPSDYIGSNIITLAATTYTPSSATQTIPSGVYLTGVQTIEPVPISVVEHRLVMPEGLIGV